MAGNKRNANSEQRTAGRTASQAKCALSAISPSQLITVSPSHRLTVSPSRLLTSSAALLTLPATLLAHGGEDSQTGPIILLWSWHRGIILSLLLLSTFYALGVRNLWRSAGVGRGISRRHVLAFAASIAALIAALLSPIDVLAEQLGWVHMVQHMILMMIAAPLFVLGLPGMAMLWALPTRQRQRFGSALLVFDRAGSGAGRRLRGYLLWHPLLTWFIFAAALWVWHEPRLYQAALADRHVHDAQHLTFFIASCLFWRVLLDPLSRLRLSPVLAVLYLFTSSLQATVLGIFMAIAPTVWYPWYQNRTGPWGLSALEDQQLAGFIMWMPACLVYAIVAAAVFGLWLHRGEGTDAKSPPVHPATAG
jgi:putative membrane protein